MFIKLSEAIRLGSMSCTKNECFRHASDGSRCALGAAEFAIGITDFEHWDETVKYWPILRSMFLSPVSGVLEPLAGIISSLNNGHNRRNGADFTSWTREAIADLVETIEAQQELQAENQRVAEPIHA